MIAALRRRREDPVPLTLAGLLIAGAALRFYAIDRQPLWLDEAFSVWMSRQPVAEMIRLTVDIDQHPPVYHLLLHLWTGIGGTGEAWVRALSALLGVLTILVMFWLGRRLAGDRLGLLAALILAFSPFHVQYAQESRSYTLLGLCAALTMWMAARLLTDPCSHTDRIGSQLWRFFRHPRTGRPGRFWQSTQTDLTWLGYMLFAALTVYGHNTGVFLPLAINVFVLALMLHRRRSPVPDSALHVPDTLEASATLQAPSLLNWAIAQFGAFLFWSPWLLPFYDQVQGVYNEFWIPRPNLEVVQETLMNFLMAWLPERIDWGWLVWVGLIATLVLAPLAFRRRRGHFWFLVALFFIPFGGELLVSLWRPIFYDRTLIWATIPLYLLVAGGVMRLRERPYIVTAALILVTMSWLSLINYYQYNKKERWDLAAAYVGKNAQAGDIIVFNAGWTQLPFDYYFSREERSLEEFGAPATLFERGELEPRMTREDIPRLEGIIQGRPRVWLVYSHNWWTDPRSLVPATLRREMRLKDAKIFYGMQVQLYERQ